MDADNNNCLCDLLQRLGTAAILVDTDGKVVGLNEAAEDCLGNGLQIRNRRLIAAHPAAQRALAQLIEGSRDGCNAHAGASDQIVIARRNARPLILRMIRLDGGAESPFHPARAIVVVLDAGRVSLPTQAQLKSAFGLSCGEAQLAILLAAGRMLENAASLCGISYETARKRVKIVFEKTDTRRQSELVALVIRIGALSAATPVVAGEMMRPMPRPLLIDGRSPSTRHLLGAIQITSRSDRWKQRELVKGAGFSGP
jgi:DNA-binding CsgD family transcriptional regulator